MKARSALWSSTTVAVGLLLAVAAAAPAPVPAPAVGRPLRPPSRRPQTPDPDPDPAPTRRALHRSRAPRPIGSVSQVAAEPVGYTGSRRRPTRQATVPVLRLACPEVRRDLGGARPAGPSDHRPAAAVSTPWRTGACNGTP